MSAVRAGRVVKSRRRPSKSVLRMMAIMTDGNKEELPKEFIEGGRTGRRNAMPDILHSDANVTTADLPERLQQLATTVVQSASSPSSDSYSSYESEDVLMKFLESDCAARRNALTKMPCPSMDQATTVTSTVFSASVSEALLDEFLHSGCCYRRDAIPCITPPPGYKKQESVSTTVSESSWKYCCSRECLDQFLKSTCSKRRQAVHCMHFPGMSESTSVKSCDLRGAQEPNLEHVCRFGVPPGTTEIIQLDEKKLMEMLNDPNNPQPGPSSEAAPPVEGSKGEEQKGS